jgi:hypothetical protein
LTRQIPSKEEDSQPIAETHVVVAPFVQVSHLNEGHVTYLVAKVAIEVTNMIATTKAENAKNHNNAKKVALKGTMKCPSPPSC